MPIEWTLHRFIENLRYVAFFLFKQKILLETMINLRFFVKILVCCRRVLCCCTTVEIVDAIPSGAIFTLTSEIIL